MVLLMGSMAFVSDWEVGYTAFVSGNCIWVGSDSFLDLPYGF